MSLGEDGSTKLIKKLKNLQHLYKHIFYEKNRQPEKVFRFVGLFNASI
ncbi:hypothetical protein HMPREF9104_02435 [Lentilactobacillus kisonensis F0435]|uniref:Uncharacterized protein n=1 Tax=Lentilactobacillus kisonensis F0435 TaxID=797516 RepID=H1LIJ4_9LACO|nr:hypothetical protein HMPREF9104_02435 [Lentilactobacillus kisonensis F0435]